MIAKKGGHVTGETTSYDLTSSDSIASTINIFNMVVVRNICDPVQQKGHLVGQVYSEIMNKTVCEI